jgi:hydrogenase 3 maturation protease
MDMRNKYIMKYVLMGIGNELRSDDGIGNNIADEFNAEGWLSLNCGTVPENFISVVERENPRLLVILDAADMDLDPGEFRILSKENLCSEIVGTHGIPLMHLVSHLERCAREIIFIGIQPGDIRLGENVSMDMENGKKRLMEILRKGDFNSIKKLY